MFNRNAVENAQHSECMQSQWSITGMPYGTPINEKPITFSQQYSTTLGMNDLFSCVGYLDRLAKVKMHVPCLIDGVM